MTSRREQIMQALFNILQGIPELRTTSRRLKLWSDVSPSDRPALFLTEHKDTILRGVEGQPGTTTINATVFLYIDAGKERNAVPIIELNTLIDAITEALLPVYPAEEQTLGGLVTHCWIAGDIMKDPGDLDGDGLAIIPISILIP